MDRVIREQARPVYTNLPIKFRVYRKYLKDRQGEAAAKLINQLTEDHWRRFIKRQHEFADFKVKVENLKPSEMERDQIAEIARACRKFYPENPPKPSKLLREDKLFINQIMAWFDHTHSEPITHGAQANHIPPAAIIIIDELQKWHPMMNQSKDKDRKYLLSYITMSRHHAHWIWVLTQDAMNVAIEFRRLAHLIWSIWNRAGDNILPGVKFSTIGLKAMGYARQTPEDYEMSKNRRGLDKKDHSQEIFTVIANTPMSKLYYRFYSSETHLGSQRQLLKKLKQSRIACGIESDNAEYDHDIKEEKQRTMKGTIYAKFWQLTGAIIAIVVAYNIGKQGTKPGAQQLDKQQLLEWPRWTMVSQTPWIGGKPIEVGKPINQQGITLRFVSDDHKSIVLTSRDEYWLWEFGTEPIRVGAIEDVRAAVAGTRAGQDQPGSPALQTD